MSGVLRIISVFLVLQVWFIQYAYPMKSYDQKHHKYFKHSGRSLASDSDFMNIDCGALENYSDKWGRNFEKDTKYINTGEVFPISSDYMTKETWPQFKYLRSFPQGRRNCYALTPKQGKNVNYLITASFKYGNYDGKNTNPVFDLYIGVNRWRTINTTQTLFSDVVYLATTDTVEVCLVNINSGTPFISALQLRPLLTNSLYQTSSSNLLALVYRFDCGIPSDDSISRYHNDDVYDRIWQRNLPVSSSVNNRYINRSDFGNGYSEQPPPMVLRTAVQPQGTWIRYNFNNIADPSSEFNVYLHLAGIVQSPQGLKRFTVTINGDIQGPYNSPEYMNTMYVYRNVSIRGNVEINISATTNVYNLPPILNALEIFIVVPQRESPSNPEDVNAIMEIKRTYGVVEDWQGDPCVPTNLSWSRLGCNSATPSRIISLNLSSSGLTGDITASLSNLKSVRVLDLSYNKLTGSIPESLAELSSLEVLNLAGNKLVGSVPKALLEKSKTGGLNLSLHENPELCFPDPCEHKKKKLIVFIIAPVASILFVAMVILLFCFCKVKILRKKMSWKWKPRVRRFKHSDIMNITKDLTSSNFLGEGAFGKVYLGQLEGTQVAVKVCSNISSAHRTEEFENEVQLLTSVNHKNVVSLIGYCYERGTIALVYEYMSNGNLDEHIKADTKRVLTWKERLQIALDAARGLAYLHKDGNKPIIHRDLKPQNILLNDNVQAKIADFGISKLYVSDRTHVTTNPKGTTGYLDPEYKTTNQLNSSSDIYSFGVVLLQLITGKGANIYDSTSGPNGTHISEWITGKNIESIVDPKLIQAGTNYNIDSVRQAKETAMACVKYTKIERPDVSWVYSELEDALKTETTLRTEYFTSQTFEINRMDTENQKTEGNVRTWLLSILNWF